MSLDKITKWLEDGGWTRDVAGDDDFDAAVNAITVVSVSRKGLIVSGSFGCGKTSLIKALTRGIKPFTIGLGKEGEEVKFESWYWENIALNPNNQNIFIDDLGSEKQANEYGIIYEPAACFVIKWHEANGIRPVNMKGPRLFITTNMTSDQIIERYGGRFYSRLKDLCVPLHLTGKDKRKWQTKIEPQTATVADWEAQ